VTAPILSRSSLCLRSAVAALLALLAACAPPAGNPEQLRAAPAPDTSAPAFPAVWEFRADAPPAVRSRHGMVASTDPLASAVGAEILRRGGNAVDAAIAVHFALAVVNPEAGNIGGGGFLVARLHDGESVALDFRERAPLSATQRTFLGADGHPTDDIRRGHRASGVPGSVAGMWEAHRRYGSMSWAELLAPAIRLADGFALHPRLAASLRSYQSVLRSHPATSAVFLPGGAPPRVGETFVQADLATTLRRIAAQGAGGFYRGRTAELIVAEMARGGGLISRRDLEEYTAVWREPVAFTYRDHHVVSMPPSSSGGATLGAMLRILEGFDVGALGWHSAEHVHLFAEAARRAYADRNAYLADPDFVPQPVERMISREYAAERRAGISLTRATPSAQVLPGLGPIPRRPGVVRAEGGNTTHFSVVDREGNAVAVTTTINSLYGSGVMVSGAGFLLNNEMDDFSVLPGVPNQFGLVQLEANVVEPGKRMLSAMTPTIVVSPDRRLLMVTGTPGGSTIITTLAQMVMNVVDFGMDPRQASAAPRIHHQHLPDVLRFERGGLAPEVVARLREMGHAVEERPGHSGDVQTVWVRGDGALEGVSDPRRGGEPAGAER
jgi:gamma-glutamyltranspeptidase / glutathione hydrolase